MRITYIFRAGRRERLLAPGEMPTEFFYGYQQLAQAGVDVRLVEDAEIGMSPPLPAPARAVNRLSGVFGDLPLGMALALAIQRGGRRLDGAGMIVATTNGTGMALAMGRAAGLVSAPVLLLAMGLLPAAPSAVQRLLYPRLLRHLHLATISQGEQAFLRDLLPGQAVHYVPFGVDHRFWTPGEAEGGDYVLAVGNDRNRDWATLVAAWSADLPPLKIVTSLPVPAAPANVEVIRGDWRTRLLSDEEMRDLMRGARFVVVPLHDTVQPAGQSACLQAMACGKPVLLSNIRGLWDRALMVDGGPVLLTPPGDVAALAARAHRLAGERGLAAAIGAAARRVVETNLNAEAMATALRALVASLDG